MAAQGMRSYEMTEIVARGLDRVPHPPDRLRAAGRRVDVVKVFPPYDHADITSALANRVVLEVLSGQRAVGRETLPAQVGLHPPVLVVRAVETRSGLPVLLTPLQLRREIERLPDTVAGLPDEQAVRSLVRELNRRIAGCLRMSEEPTPPGGGSSVRGTAGAGGARGARRARGRRRRRGPLAPGPCRPAGPLVGRAPRRRRPHRPSPPTVVAPPLMRLNRPRAAPTATRTPSAGPGTARRRTPPDPAPLPPTTCPPRSAPAPRPG